MKKRILLSLAMLAWAGNIMAAPLMLFGASLKNATRSSLEASLQKAGLSAIQVGAQWWFDVYQVSGQLPGADKLSVGYTANNQFAIAEYEFPSFMDMGQVEKIITMTQDKYGPPGRQSGSPNLGNVTAIWNEGNGMQIRVWRGWPQTTTYLDLVDVSNYSKMKQQMQVQKEKEEAKQAQSHSNAF